MASGDGLDSELDSFRKKWLSDLQSQRDSQPSATAATTQSSSHRRRKSQSQQHHVSSSASQTALPRKSTGPPSPTAARRTVALDEALDYLEGPSFDELAPSLNASSGPRTLASSTDATTKSNSKNIVSALDYYEEAMEKEAQGNMGESLQLYRKAYRMDHGVDRRYREKHFPAPAKAAAVPASAGSTNASVSASASVSAAAEAPASKELAFKDAAHEPEPVQPKTFSELIADFAALKIEPAVPNVEGTPPPPCPIAALPDELLTHILHDVAVADIAAYVRLSLVCKRLAYLVASEQRIWRRVCLGPEFGFAGMHYRWNRSIEWGPLAPESESESEQDTSSPLLSESDEPTEGHNGGNSNSAPRRLSPRELAHRRRVREQTVTLSLTPSVYPTWKKMFRNRPRIRFDGCYIATINYVRSGQASTNQLTWGGAPIHIVTYYRYLRFFRDGSLISLLASNEPSEVVHYLTRDALLLHRDAAQNLHLPSAVMRLAYRGRWHLSRPGHGSVPGSGNRLHGPDSQGAPSGDDELSIETEGVGNKYIFKIDLQMRSTGKGTSTRNNKLMMRGFYSYNKLTEDWAEFVLKHNKPFIFSRVRSYGLGE